MKRDKIDNWEIIISPEEGKTNRPTATTPFDIPSELYVEKDPCVRPYNCDETNCDLFCWKLKWNNKNSKKKMVSLTGEILVEFVSLSNEKIPENFAHKVELFAQKWGSLDLCEEHQMPSSHSNNCVPSISHRKFVLRPISILKERESEIFCESLAIWHDYSLFAKSLLNIAANLQEAKFGKDEDWRNLHSLEFIGQSLIKERERVFPPEEKTLREFLADEKKQEEVKKFLQFEKNLIADGVNKWLAIGNLRPEMRWENDNIVIEFKSASSYGSLFAYLALQLILAIGKQDGLAICSFCGNSYIPKRKPAKNKRRFCSKCDKAAKAFASADYRKRLKDKNRL